MNPHSRPVILQFTFLTVLLSMALTPRQGAAQQGAWGEGLILRIDSLAESVVGGNAVASLSIGVQKGGEVLLARSYGAADLENGVAATAETVYRIGSITKQFTAVAIMQLVREGVIALDDPLTKYFPDYPSPGEEVTIRHLLTHTSGIPDLLRLPTWRTAHRQVLTDEEIVALFANEPFHFTPGERFTYSNSGYLLLGMIVGEVSGLSYREYVEDQLLRPLGLENSHYCDDRRLISNRASGYQASGGTIVNAAFVEMELAGGAGALCSTVPDLLRWSRALRSGGVVTPDAYSAMTTLPTLPGGSTTRYGFGLRLGSFEGHPTVEHGGGINGFTAQATYYPQEDLDIVVLSNTVGPHAVRVAEVIGRWTLGLDLSSVVDIPLSAEERGVYEGLYQQSPQVEFTVSSRSGQLYLEITRQGTRRLRAQGDHLFVPEGLDHVRIQFIVEGEKAERIIFQQGGMTIEGSRVR